MPILNRDNPPVFAPGRADPQCAVPRRRCESDRGSAAVQTVLAMPIILLLVLALTQVSERWYTSHAARAVAFHALEALRVQGGSVAVGRAEATAMIRQLGPGILAHTQVTLTRTATTAVVTVTATPPRVLPLPNPPVRVTETAPVEHTTTAMNPRTGGRHATAITCP
jgi:Flp pilus assembly protein TadG